MNFVLTVYYRDNQVRNFNHVTLQEAMRQADLMSRQQFTLKCVVYAELAVIQQRPQAQRPITPHKIAKRRDFY